MNVRGTWLMCGIETGQRLYIPMENLVGLFRQLTNGNAPLGGARIDLVIDVRDVSHVSDVSFAIDMAQQAEKNVKDDDRPRIADMGKVVDSRAAHIHAHASRIERSEYPLLARQRIVELELHSR